MKIEELSVEAIKPYEKNPRKNDGSVNGVAESIKQFGFQQPIVIDKSGVIVAGHTRYKAVLKLGLATVPCVRADQLTAKQVKAYRILDNKLNELSTWDFPTLEAELANVKIDFADFDVQMPTFDIESAFSTSEGQAAVGWGGATSGAVVGGNGADNVGGGEIAGTLPPELQGVDLSPAPLPTINGEDKTVLDRVIIVFPVDRKQDVAEYLGLEKLDKVVYHFNELQEE